MRKSFKRLSVALVAATAATSVAAGLGLATSASATQSHPSGPQGAATTNVDSGSSDTAFTLGFAAAAGCPGNSDSGYFVQSFITSRANDPKDMTFSNTTPAGAGYSGFTAYLRNGSGQAQKNLLPASSSPYDVAPLSNIKFDGGAFTSITAGEYWIGVACSFNDGTTVEMSRFWAIGLTITADAVNGGTNGFTWKKGFVPNAPTLGARTAGAGQVQVAFTAGAAITGNPATTNYTVVVKDSTCTNVAGAALTNTGSSSPITVTGLTNGTTYCFAVKATNSTGDSSLSSTGTSTPNPAQRGAVTNLQAAPGVEKITLSWTAPSPTPTGYTITVSPNTGTGSFVAGPYTGVTGTSKEITGLTGGTLYTFTITPSTYSDSPTGGGSYTGTAANVQATPNSNQVIGQDNSVTRPAGALLIYVKCGVYGALDSYTKTSGVFPGFPKTLTSATATGSGAEAGGGSAACTLDMGTAELVRLTDDSALGGNFFTASGRLSQVSVLDTRDSDLGWSVTATAGTLTGSVSGSISGNYLGWIPKVTATSAAYGTYDQTATAGATVLPGTGVSSGDGLGDGTPNVLASAAAGAGLGEATLDGRLLLLIPVSADAQVYTGSMTLSLI
ncbi:MAG: fibronectin type III domain-containing protein [Actinomycetota bacterium]